MKKVIVTFAVLPEPIRFFTVENECCIVLTISNSYREDVEAILAEANPNER